MTNCCLCRLLDICHGKIESSSKGITKGREIKVRKMRAFLIHEGVYERQYMGMLLSILFVITEIE